MQLHFIIFYSFIINCVNLWSNQLTGTVINKIDSHPVEFANVILLSSADSSFLAGTYTKADGFFSFDKLDKDTYILKISYIGYEEYIRDVFLPQEPNDTVIIELSRLTENLNEVVIASKVPPFQMNNNNLIANVSTTLLNSVGTASDVLQRIPGIVMEDGKITVFGKGEPVVYLNNRKVRDNQELERLESSEISTVELFTGPSAKYDAEGRAVLLIKTKKNPNGFSAQLVERIRQGNHTGDNENVTVSYTKDNLILFASGYHQYGKMTVDENHHIILHSERQWEHNINMPAYKYSNNSRQVSAGFDWTPNKRHAIGGQYLFYTLKHVSPSQTNSITYLDNAPYDESFQETFLKEDRYQHSLNSFYKGDFNERVSLRFDVDYLKTHNNRAQFTEEISNPENRTINTFSQTDYDLYAGKLMNSYRTDAGLLEFGGEYGYIAGNGSMLNPEKYTGDNIYSNSEQKTAFFISYSHKFGNIQFDAGLRYEHTQEKFTEDSVKTPIIDRKYDDVYPNLSVSKKIRNVDLSIALNKRTQRPTFSQLNGNTFYVNRFVFQKGNPYLKKTDIYDINCKAIFKNFYWNVGYTYEKDPVTFYYQKQEANSNGILSTFANFSRYQELNSKFNFNSKIAFWQPNYTVGIRKPFFSTDYGSQKLTYDQPDYFFRAYNDFILPESFVLSCNFRYQSDCAYYYIKLQSQQQFDLGLRKSLFENRIRLNLEFYDIFNWVKEQNFRHLNNFDWNTDKKRETRYVLLSITYLFNNYQKKYRGGSAAENDINRF